MRTMRFSEMVGRFDGTAQVVGVPTPKSVYQDGRRTDEQKKDAQGVPLWSLPVLFMPANVQDDRAEVVNVTIASAAAPETAPGTPVNIGRGVHFSVYGSDRGGVGYVIYLTPDAVRPQQAAKVASAKAE